MTFPFSGGCYGGTQHRCGEERPVCLSPATRIETSRAGGGHNTAEGHTCLQAWLETQGVMAQETLGVMEATGVYWERVALKLHLAGDRVSVVNAAQIKSYAKSTLRRGKTDKMDAARWRFLL